MPRVLGDDPGPAGRGSAEMNSLLILEAGVLHVYLLAPS
jgi:hypothetical protein